MVNKAIDVKVKVQYQFFSLYIKLMSILFRSIFFRNIKSMEFKNSKKLRNNSIFLQLIKIIVVKLEIQLTIF